ncbi:protein kinase C-binding protein 1 isoform X2 [Cephus cinctus]|uniref:Protein kinase C-binding protein 1 isoform X2 n=1 Tax=Cephus cinctus TaxID=211228 RepID=A0AAJ7FQY4_CEPCN|nr:protein kinase C-binding protein 1 isoform X2 [Cephus cinctus]
MASLSNDKAITKDAAEKKPKEKSLAKDLENVSKDSKNMLDTSTEDAKDKKLEISPGSDNLNCPSKESKKEYNPEDIKTLETEFKKPESDLKIEEANECTAQDSQPLDIRISSLLASKDTKNGEEIRVEEAAKNEKEGKRKRRNPSVQSGDLSSSEDGTRIKRKRSKSVSDGFCWRCHKESVEAQCSACPRSWHRKCMGGAPPTSVQNWICGECATILRAENAETRSPAMSQLSVDQLCMLLKHVVERMRHYPGSEPFWKAVDLSEVPNYLDYVVKPMDLSLLESNVRAKLYGSTDAFMADAKWIQHNCIVFNTCGGVYADTSKLTNAARQIIKAARQEVSEIEACPDCYAHGRNLPRPQPSWFIEPCRRPHPLVWAKLKGFPYWPAKAMPRVNGQGYVDVRFFGAHDRAWISPRDLYLYSEDPPSPLPRKRKLDMDECVREITRHCRKLELVFGQFRFAPPKIQYNPQDPMQIKLMLPNYDPLHPNITPEIQTVPPKRKSLQKKRAPLFRKKALISESPTNTTADSANDSVAQRLDSNSDCEKYIEIIRIGKTSTLGKKTERTTSSSKEDIVVAPTGKKQKVRNRRSSALDTRTSGQTASKASSEKDALIRLKPSNELINNVITDKESSKDVPEKRKANATRQASADKRLSQKGGRTSEGESNIKNPNFKTYSLPGSPVNAPAGLKPIKNLVRVYKPKTRMVNQVNAEMAKESATDAKETKETGGTVDRIESNEIPAEVDASTNNSSVSPVSSTVPIATPTTVPDTTTNSVPSSKDVKHNNSQATHVTPISSNSTGEQPLAFFFLVNNSKPELRKRPASLENNFPSTETLAIVKQEPRDHHASPQSAQKRESKARKSFPNKPPVYPQIAPRSPPKAPSSPPDAMVYIPGHRDENELAYQLPPPEAGPLSAQLHRGAQELARRMAQLMEEALRESAQTGLNPQDDPGDNGQATIHFLKLQIERMRWQHQQQLTELKHNTDLTLREMRASLEAERHRAVEEARRQAEEEKLRSVEETKRKQWCALCGNEALFYCCWNTAYCDYPCQQAHWPSHMRTCAQKPPQNTILGTTATNSNNNQQQVMPRLLISTQQAPPNVWGA